jgi:hypothetical protein
VCRVYGRPVSSMASTGTLLPKLTLRYAAFPRFKIPCICTWRIVCMTSLFQASYLPEVAHSFATDTCATSFKNICV